MDDSPLHLLAAMAKLCAEGTDMPNLRFLRSIEAAALAMVLALGVASQALAEPRSFQLRDGQVIITVTLEGRELPALLDTGATRSLIEVGLAKELGIRTRKLRGGGGTYGAAGGKVGFGFTRDITFDFGAGAIRRTLGTYEAAHAFAADGVRMLIGMDMLADMAIRLDFERMTIDIQRPADFRPPEGKPLSLTASGWGRPTLAVELGGVRAEMLIDTAASGALHLDSSFVAASPVLKALPASPRRIVGIDGARDRDAIVVPSVTLGGEVFKDVRASSGSFAIMRGVDGIVGVDLLKRFNLVIDLGGYRMWMTPLSAQHAD